MASHDIASPYLIYLGDTDWQELAKTGLGLVYWRPERCIGQLREKGCGADLGIPDMTLETAAHAGAKTLVIGTAIIGGKLPEAWIARLVEALHAGFDIASGLHEPLASIPQLRDAAKASGQRLHDVRIPTGPFPIATGKPRSGKRLLALGTDCAVGKKYAALAIHAEMLKQGMNATFRATGQTGILIDGSGLSVDAIVSDFLAGAVEQMIPAAADDHWDVIEGQGALVHPAFAGVTLGLLHGAQPQAFVVCHEAGRETLSGFGTHPVGGIAQIIALTKSLCSWFPHEIACVGLCINTSRLDEAEARAYLTREAAEHGVPACDPVRFGVEEIVEGLR
ncbi:MAG: DUF1611 domain-containing protein [Paracoccaceae bacterium]